MALLRLRQVTALIDVSLCNNTAIGSIEGNIGAAGRRNGRGRKGCVEAHAGALGKASSNEFSFKVLFLTYIYLYLVTLSYTLQIEPLFESLMDLFFWLGALS